MLRHLVGLYRDNYVGASNWKLSQVLFAWCNSTAYTRSEILWKT